MAGPNPFAKSANAKKGGMPFEKSAGDKDTKAVFKKFGPEGSKKEEAFDKKQGSKGPAGQAMTKNSVQPATTFKKK